MAESIPPARASPNYTTTEKQQIRDLRDLCSEVHVMSDGLDQRLRDPSGTIADPIVIVLTLSHSDRPRHRRCHWPTIVTTVTPAITACVAAGIAITATGQRVPLAYQSRRSCTLINMK
ncbi:hypothetical protein CcaverHIS002_0403650 [Cutaneotrichosporon cavernicola]|nr:hypothetical protein CcaverHIS002_0403650 [Cutaneotrichosporon cavernicola]